MLSGSSWLSGLGVCAGLILAGAAALAADEKPAIPLERVVLFNSGVGFYEHRGTVENDAKVEMRFNIRDINDLLKSMVVQDFDKGQVSTVSYASKDPISKTLKTFAIDLTANPTLAQLLGQVRGERVEVELPAKVSGVILGVETRKKKVGDDEFIEVDMLNLLTDTGLRSISLDTVNSIRLTNESLQAELNKALALLATAHATDKKAVTLNFAGEGKRRVSVGYIQESPIWKTTYRLVLDEQRPLLQGWAIVENTSEQDWSKVDLTLVSGRPISFTMDLYEPLYVPRPEVQLELYASLRPQTYGQDMGRASQEFAAIREREEQVAQTARRKSFGEAKDEADGGEKMDRVAALSKALPPSSPRMDLRQGVQSVAQAADVGETFQYKIQTPVDLPRQQSAMLPIVNAEIEGQKVSIYNSGVHAKHPLAGLRFTNTTDLHLMQGPITVFDGGAYAGDAKIEDIPPKSERLISYAMDLDTEVAPQAKSKPEELLSVKLVKGTLHAARKYVRGQDYTIKNSGRKAKTVLIEYPVSADWKLVKPAEPTEKTRDLYRFAVAAKPGEPATLSVEEERTDTQFVALTNIDDGSVRFYMSATVVSEKVKAALAEVVKRRHAIQQLAVERQQREQKIAEIDKDQARIRQNMAQLDRQSDLYRDYVKEFSEQETQLKKLRGEISELQGKEQDLRRSLDEYLMGLDLS
jgi:hypothetical protein